MKIHKLRLKNFRCFEDLTLSLDPQYTILVGINGAGKSTILDALAVALGGYLAGFDGIRSNYIQSEDAHCKMHSAGSRIDVQAQFPVQVSAEAELDGGKRIISWQRELNGTGKRTTHGNSKEILAYAKELQESVRLGTKACILPMIAYYSTGRLWMQKRSKKTADKKKETLNRQKGYMDCLDVASNEKQMMKWFEEMTYIQLQEGKAVPELEAVKKALKACYMSSDAAITDADFNYNVKSGELEIIIYRENEVEKLPVKMLSDGEKGVISMVADIAYRMALLNPNLYAAVLDTPGIVLIDEIDMHLHPLWQKKIMNDLTSIFPKVQFIVTTHSPNVLANITQEHIRILNHYQLYQAQNTTYGRSVEDILREIMGADVRPDRVRELLENFDRSIDQEDYEKAKMYLDETRDILGEHAKEVIENQITLDIEMQE